ncbi:DUF2523 domain-containing protein [Pseudomonas sp. LPB0260]|uniref:DUF2523 domain-containing protein n=1 Tax=Pseudomonas sp. LPB0260 TaxID=2614442 RepID=UPI0015C2BE09|nr:DUF2523 domain-containing protein [Pseudomonas sp. LPB0260]QLC73848.1 DUF2523 domain-containing protein [Pseudomonas sp. LPB0260]QLC76622.1 DUF2523 domain-containing protein [Pseudomonas sp. LPB0260]
MQYLFIAQLLIMIVGPLVKMVLRILGFGFVTYFGFNLIIGQAQSYVFARMGEAGPIIQQILGLAKFDVVINIFFAAIATRFILAGIDKATDRKRNQVWHKPGGTSIDA